MISRLARALAAVLAAAALLAPTALAGPLDAVDELKEEAERNVDWAYDEATAAAEDNAEYAEARADARADEKLGPCFGAAVAFADERRARADASASEAEARALETLLAVGRIVRGEEPPNGTVNETRREAEAAVRALHEDPAGTTLNLTENATAAVLAAAALVVSEKDAAYAVAIGLDEGAFCFVASRSPLRGNHSVVFLDDLPDALEEADALAARTTGYDPNATGAYAHARVLAEGYLRYLGVEPYAPIAPPDVGRIVDDAYEEICRESPIWC